MITITVMIPDSPAVLEFEDAHKLSVAFSVTIAFCVIPYKLKLATHNAKWASAFLGVDEHDLTIVFAWTGFRGKPARKRDHVGRGFPAALPLVTHGTRFPSRNALRGKEDSHASRRFRRGVQLRLAVVGEAVPPGKRSFVGCARRLPKRSPSSVQYSRESSMARAARPQRRLAGSPTLTRLLSVCALTC